MKTEKSILIGINLLLGSILLYSYYRGIETSKLTIDDLWGGIVKTRWLYFLSGILAIIGYLYILYFLVFKMKTSMRNNHILSNISVVQLLIITISMLWLPLTIQYLRGRKRNPLLMLGIVLVLLIVSLAALKQVYLIKKIDHNNLLQKNLAILGGSYLFIHSFLFDAISWNYNFFY